MFVLTMSSGNASAQQLPYQNPALSAHERAVDLWQMRIVGRLLSVHTIFVGCSNALVRFRSSSGSPPPRDCANSRASQMTGIVPKR